VHQRFGEADQSLPGLEIMPLPSGAEQLAWSRRVGYLQPLDHMAVALRGVVGVFTEEPWRYGVS
jgi:hypothetical protein